MKLLDKIFVKEAIELLGIQDKPICYVINSLMTEENLSTYFDIDIEATEGAEYEMRIINNNGDELPFVGGSPTTTIEGERKKILEINSISDDEISVLIFEHEGKQYCCADADGGYLRPIILSSSDIYFDKIEFGSYQDVPAYQDENHDLFAPELDLAIQLHKAIHIEKFGNQGRPREERISKWLTEKFPDEEFPGAKITRLSTIIGIKK